MSQSFSCIRSDLKQEIWFGSLYGAQNLFFTDQSWTQLSRFSAGTSRDRRFLSPQFRGDQPREIRAPPAGEAEEQQGGKQHCWRQWCGSLGASWWESARGRTLSLAIRGKRKHLKCHTVSTNLCSLMGFEAYLDWWNVTCQTAWWQENLLCRCLIGRQNILLDNIDSFYYVKVSHLVGLGALNQEVLPESPPPQGAK